MLIEFPIWGLKSFKKMKFFVEIWVKGTILCITKQSTTGICINSEWEKSSIYYVAWWQLNNFLQHFNDFFGL